MFNESDNKYFDDTTLIQKVTFFNIVHEVRNLTTAEFVVSSMIVEGYELVGTWLNTEANSIVEFCVMDNGVCHFFSGDGEVEYISENDTIELLKEVLPKL